MIKLFKKGPAPLIESNIGGLVRDGDEYFANELILLNHALNGNLYCAEQALVGQAGVLTGNITAKVCVISGKVNGHVTGTERVLVKSTAHINGNVKAAAIDVEPGAKINGRVKTATDIYAIVALTETLKKHLDTDQLPPKLNIAAQSVTITHKVDEPAKAMEQKANAPRPVAAAASPMAAKPAVELATIAASSKPVAAAAAKPANEPVAAPAPVALKPVAAAAAPQLKKEEDEGANGRWW